MAVWSWFSCAIKFYIVIFRLYSRALYSIWYSRGLTAVMVQVQIIWERKINFPPPFPGKRAETRKIIVCPFSRKKDGKLIFRQGGGQRAVFTRGHHFGTFKPNLYQNEGHPRYWYEGPGSINQTLVISKTRTHRSQQSVLFQFFFATKCYTWM